MKKLPFAIAIIITVTLAGCTGRSGNMRMLDKADAIMEEYPDSALALLQEINAYSLADNEEKARYALLLSMALDKNYINITSDSLINIASSYYSDMGYSKEAMLTFFYKAKTEYYTHKYDLAIKSAICAIDAATNLDDTLWLARCNEAVADIYSDTYAYPKAIYHRTIAADLYRAMDKKLNEFYSKCDLALELGSIKCNSKSINLIDSLIQTSSKEFPNDSLLIAHTLSSALWIYSYSGNYAKALDSWERRTAEYSTIPLSQSDLIDGARIQLYYNNIEDAKRLADYAAKTASESLGGRMQIIALNYSLSRYSNNNGEALAAADSIFSIIDNNIVSIASNTALDGRGDYHDDMSKRLIGLSVTKDRTIIGLFEIILSSIIVCIIIVMLLNWVKKMGIKKRDKSISELYNSIMGLLCAIDDIKKKMHDKIAENEKMVSEISYLNKEKDSLTSENESLSQRIDNIILDSEKLSDRIGIIDNQIKTLTHEKKELAHKNSEQDTLIRQLTDERAHLYEEKRLLNECIELLKSEKSRIIQETDMMTGSMNNLNTQIAKLQEISLRMRDTKLSAKSDNMPDGKVSYKSKEGNTCRLESDMLDSFVQILNSMCAQHMLDFNDHTHKNLIKDGIVCETEALRDPEFVKVITNSVNTRYNGIITKIKQADPNLSDENMKFTALLIAGVNYRIIALIMGLKYDSIPSKRMRILRRIKDVGVEGVDELISSKQRKNKKTL